VSDHRSTEPRGSGLAEPAAHILRHSPWVRVAVRLAALALVAFLALRLRQLWQQSPVDLSAADTSILAIAGIMSLVAVVAYGSVWPFILRQIGAPIPSGAVRLFLQSQLGKYLPGSVWHYAGRIGLARTRGVAVRSTLVSLGVEVGASALAAVIVGLFVLPLTLAAPLAFAVAAAVAVIGLAPGRTPQRLFDPLIRVTRRIVPVSVVDMRQALRALPPATALYVPVWALYGVAFWLVARALFPIPTTDIVFFTAAFALGWLAGMLVVFAPGGIGVREAVLVGLLAPRVGHAEAIVIAGASRILLTAADLVGGGAALALSRLQLGRVSAAAGRGGK